MEEKILKAIRELEESLESPDVNKFWALKQIKNLNDLLGEVRSEKNLTEQTKSKTLLKG